MAGHDIKFFPTSNDLHVLELARLVVEAHLGLRYPARELARLELRLHQAFDEVAVGIARQEVAPLVLPLRIAQQYPVHVRLDLGELADVAVKGDVRQFDLEWNAEALDPLVQ